MLVISEIFFPIQMTVLENLYLLCFVQEPGSFQLLSSQSVCKTLVIESTTVHFQDEIVCCLSLISNGNYWLHLIWCVGLVFYFLLACVCFTSLVLYALQYLFSKLYFWFASRFEGTCFVIFDLGVWLLMHEEKEAYTNLNSSLLKALSLNIFTKFQSYLPGFKS